MTDSPTRASTHVRAIHDVITHAVSDADAATLRTVIDALLGACVSEREDAERFRQLAAEWKNTGDTVRRAVCEGQAHGRHMGAERIEERILGALDLWQQCEKATAGIPDDEPSYLPTVTSETESIPAGIEDSPGGGQ